MSKFDDAFDPPTPLQLSRHRASGALAGVQTSLYANLKWRYPVKSGTVAWMLVRLAQPDHEEFSSSRGAISKRDGEDIVLLVEAVKKTKRSKKGDGAEWQRICDAILSELASVFRAPTTSTGAPRDDGKRLVRRISSGAQFRVTPEEIEKYGYFSKLPVDYEYVS